MDERDLFYDRMVAERDWHDTANPYETARRLRIVFEELLAGVALEGARFLDGGSGGGHFSAEAAGRGADVTSLDLGLNLMAQVRKRCDSRLVAGSLLQIPFADESFDVVMSTEVVEHTPEPKLALGELARVLRIGGTLVVTTPNRLWQPVVRAASALGLRPFQGRENFLWPRAARAALVAAGIDVRELRGFNLLPLFQPRLEPLHRRADRLGGRFVDPFLNFGLRGVKERRSA